MKKLSSRLLPLFLSLVILLSLVPSALADDYSDRMEAGQAAAEELNRLGLFRGAGTLPDGNPDFALERSPTRAEALVMLVRILGGEREAVLAGYVCPFGDIYGHWSEPLVAYGWYHGIVNGTGDPTSFGRWTYTPDSLIPLNQFLTMLLRSMGYSDVDWQNPYPLADEIGLYYPTGEGFYRADLASICLSALDCRTKEGVTLRKALSDAGAFDGGSVPANGFTAGPAVEPVTDLTVSTAEELALKLAQASAAHMPTVSFTTSSDTGELYNAFSDGYRDLFYNLGNSNGYSVTYGGDYMSFTLKYQDSALVMGLLEGRDGLEWDDDTAALVNKAKSILSQIAYPGMDDYDIVKAIHDYIVNNNTYLNDGTDRVYTASAVLIDGHSVCEGYTLAFDLMCYLAGIECVNISGSAGGGGHAWNKVKVNGQWYNVDVTWDDPVTSSGQNMLRYNYFLVSDATLSRDHTWTLTPHIPASPTDYSAG